jgi:hypothetical protein
MSNIAIGIMCFGDESYFTKTKNKLTHLNDMGIKCYVLTDEPNQFTSNTNIRLIDYNRRLKSYHDKIILVKEILKQHNISIIIDADTLISDYSFVNQLNNYPYQKGISYVETLLGHKIRKEYVKDIQMNPDDVDWLNYKTYLQKIYPQYGDLETIYEYFLVFNKEGLKDNFYQMYEKLQVIKESCDVISGRKTVVGSGEGISIQISARICGVQIQRDNELYTLIKDKIDNTN